MKILVCGSRGLKDTSLVTKAFGMLPVEEHIFIHGDASGADRLAGNIAFAMGWETIEKFPANWDEYGKAAGFIRNIEMLDQNPDLVIAFWDGVSKGTHHTINEAKKRKIPTWVYYFKENHEV